MLMVLRWKPGTDYSKEAGPHVSEKRYTVQWKSAGRREDLQSWSHESFWEEVARGLSKMYNSGSRREE